MCYLIQIEIDTLDIFPAPYADPYQLLPLSAQGYVEQSDTLHHSKTDSSEQ
jgi:hypothetical protein